MPANRDVSSTLATDHRWSTMVLYTYWLFHTQQLFKNKNPSFLDILHEVCERFHCTGTSLRQVRGVLLCSWLTTYRLPALLLLVGERGSIVDVLQCAGMGDKWHGFNAVQTWYRLCLEMASGVIGT
eukprot:scaffold242276_cov24-Tisochrysis_lutea.AAC.1